MARPFVQLEYRNNDSEFAVVDGNANVHRPLSFISFPLLHDGDKESSCQPMDPAKPADKSFDDQIRDHVSVAIRFAHQLAGDSELAEEIVQEAMVRAIRARDTFRGESSFATWLFQIILNVLRDHNRKRKPESLAPDKEICSNTPSPLQTLKGEELKVQIRMAIDKLPERQRTVLVLSAWQQCSSDEIATITGMSLDNVHSTLSLARRRIKQLLRGYLGGVD